LVFWVLINIRIENAMNYFFGLANSVLKNNWRDVALSLAISVTSFLVNRSWTVDPYGWVDQWAYFGSAIFYPESLEAFPDLPASGLLAVLLPQIFYYKYLGVILGGVILDIANLTLVSFFMIGILRSFTTRALALQVIVLALANQYWLSTIGSSYTVAYVFIYALAALYFLTKAALAYQNHRFGSLMVFAASICISLMMYSAILSVSYVPIFAAYFIYLRRSLGHTKILVKDIRNFLSIGFCGFTVTTVCLQAVFSSYGTGFFFATNINKLLSFTVGNAYRAPEPHLWLAEASWVIVPLVISIAATARIIFLWKNKSLLSPVQALLFLAPLSFATLTLINVSISQWSLQFLYFNQTLPFYYLSLGALVFEFSTSRRQIGSSLLLSSAIVMISYWFISDYHYTFGDFRRLLMGESDYLPNLIFLLGIAFLSALLIIWFVLRRKFVTFAIVFLTLLSTLSFSPSFGCFLCFDSRVSRSSVPAIASGSDRLYTNTVALSERIVELDPERRAKIWFSEFSEEGPLVRQANAVVYLNDARKRVSKSFPAIDDVNGAPIGSEGSGIASGDKILLISSVESDFELAVSIIKSLGLNADHKGTSRLTLVPRTVLYLSVILVQ